MTTQVIERPVAPSRLPFRKPQTVIEIEDTPVQQTLDEMLTLVRGGKWTTGSTNYGGRHCAVGLVEKVTGWSHHYLV